ncbi:MFS general substrate transporter [Aspergillus ellipticus CBS 707.79]|uniref:MFS general substrate transporter n=1 Tax=Aspergillus ellipticus CBS 707.79 TaxID=1448320 RepID=A0A319DK75_9EURO|nr:MFS general substrate transporter [Aspergillus ellipticus CBS 707.79]
MEVEPSIITASSEYSEHPEYPDDREYPDGGLKAWLVVLGAWCAMVPALGLMNTAGTLHIWTSTHQLKDYPDSSYGWIYGVYGFFLYFAGAQSGPILDTWGPTYVIIPGSIGMVVALVCFSFSEEYYQVFLSFGVLGGLSASALFTPAIAAIGHWFEGRQAFVTGITCTAGGLGGVIFPAIIYFTAPKIGFGWSIRIIALISAVLCVAACFLIKTRLPLGNEPGRNMFLDFRTLMDAKYATTTAAIFLVEFAVFVPSTYLSSYAVHVGLSNEISYLVLVFLNSGLIPGRLLPGLAADRLGRFNTMVLTSLVCSILTLALWYKSGSSLGAIVGYAVLFGFWSGAAMSLSPVCISQICTTEDYGKRMGTTYTIASIGILTGIPIAGAIQQRDHGEYGGLIIFAGVLYLAAAVAFAVARGICRGWSWKTRF